MNRRIWMWVVAGILVATFWVVFGLIAGPGTDFGHWLVTSITAPAAVLCRAVRFPVKYYEFIALNAAVYALIGLSVETARRFLRSPLLHHSNR